MVKIYYSHDRFVTWLEHRIFEKYGRRASDRAVCRDAGIPVNMLHKIIRGGQKPSDGVAKALANLLGVPSSEFRRRAGLDPMLEANEEDIVSKLTPQEIEEYLETMNTVVKALQNQRSRRRRNDAPADDEVP